MNFNETIDNDISNDIDPLAEQLYKRLQKEYSNFSIESNVISHAELKVFILLYIKLQSIISRVYKKNENIDFKLNDIKIYDVFPSVEERDDDGNIIDIKDFELEVDFTRFAKTLTKDFFSSNGKLFDDILKSFAKDFGYKLKPKRDLCNNSDKPGDKPNPFHFDETI